jgi:menaquinone-dependent protoporphyrinogen IX oxidase
VKLWIIYENGISFSTIIAERLQDHLEEYIDVSVGNAKKIEPKFLIEEKLDYLIIGDNISDIRPSEEIQDWLFKYKDVSKENNFILKALSCFCIVLTDTNTKLSWVEFIQKNINSEIFFPPMLCLKLERAGYTLENSTLELVKNYSNNIIEYIIESEN